jgi:predicted DNA-binding transcriptional regulator AlpA
MELITVANYAKKKGVSSTWVYKLIAKGKIECKIIDGIKFIVI